MVSGDYLRSETSPDGRFRVDYAENEMRASQWVSAPTVHDLSRNAVVFKVDSTQLHGNEEWSNEPGCFTLYMSKYPYGGQNWQLDFDVDAGTVRIDDEEERHPIESALPLLWCRIRAWEKALPPPPPYKRPSNKPKLRDLVLGILIVLAFVAAVALFFYLRENS